MKRQVKAFAMRSIARLAPVAWRALRSPRLLVLMYHRVLPEEHPDRRSEQPGMYVSPKTLAMHLDLLKENGFDSVRIDEWLGWAHTGKRLPRLAYAITFDDGWRDNLEHAFPVLVDKQVPATIFLVSGLIGSRCSFWPNVLARALASSALGTIAAVPRWLEEIIRRVAPATSAGLNANAIDSIVNACKAGRSDADMLSVARSLECQPSIAMDIHRDLLNWSEVRKMGASGLVTFGSHTCHHTRLTDDVLPEILHKEIVGSLGTLERQLGYRPSVFCYPNGDTCMASVALVRSMYLGGVTTRRGWHTPDRDPFLIRRIGMHEDASYRPELFLARLSNWL